MRQWRRDAWKSFPGVTRKGVIAPLLGRPEGARALACIPITCPTFDPVPVPADVGDAVMMTNLTPHRSTDNVSGLIRWSADLRFNSPDAGDFGPNEASFLGRSNDRPDDVVTDWRVFEAIRVNHVPSIKIDRTWLQHDEESFQHPEKRLDLAR